MISNRIQRGFTLIEMMIALLIFSIGLMGMAGLMVLSVKTNQSAYLRTQAAFLAQSMADRMRANMGLIDSYEGSYSYATAGTDPCASGIACSPAQTVVRDRAVWSQQLIDSMPNPTAAIDCDGAVLGGVAHRGAAPFDGMCTLTITWDEATFRRGALSATPGAATADLQTFAWVFQP
jgi:type IV pilus assembly protein PilV